MPKRTKPKTIPRWLQKSMVEISQFILLFTDIDGFLKTMTITGEEIMDVLNYGQGFDGSSVEGFVRINESDLMAYPRLRSFRVLPAKLFRNGSPTGIFFCDLKKPNGRPFAGDPRQCLKRVIRQAKKYRFLCNVGPEIEFFIFPNSQTPVPLDSNGYFDSPSNDFPSTILREAVKFLRQIGIQVECSHHEVAKSQFEIDVKYQDALTAADQVMLIRWIVKLVSEQHECYATFLPKPINEENGSGMHVHMSLMTSDGRNAFFSSVHPLNLSKTARYFIAGILDHCRDFSIVTNQLINSYKRLVPGFEAPCYLSYGQRNRSSLIRVPRYRIGRETATRIELRSPDPACNPYLTFAVMLAAGLDGINRQCKLGPPMEQNIYDMSPEERRKQHITTLPGSLFEAIEIAQTSRFLRQTLGLHIFNSLLKNAKAEWESYCRCVTDFEIKHLMPRY